MPRVGDDTEMAGHGRDLGLGGGELSGDLVAHGSDRLRIGADEDDPGPHQGFGELRTLGQETVARMHGLCVRVGGGGDDLVDREIARGGGGRPDRHRLVGHCDVQRVLVGFRIDRDGLDPEASRRPDDAAGDLAAIGDQDALEHAR